MANFRRQRIALALAMSLGGSAAIAGPGVFIGDATGAPGGTVTVDLRFEAGASVASGDITIDYDESVLTPQPLAGVCGGPVGTAGASASCNDTGSTIQVIIVAPIVFPIPALPDAPLGSIVFDVDAAAAESSTSPLAIASENYFNTTGAGVSPSPSAAEREGVISIATPTGPTLAADPTSVSITTAVNSAGTQGISFSATGDSGSVTGISCAGSGDAQITYSDSIPTSLPVGDDFSVTASCQSGAPGSFTSTYTCSFDGAGEGGQDSVSVPVSCDVEAGAAVPAFNPANGGALTIGGLLPGSGGSGEVVFSETNGGGTGYSATCSVTAGSSNFSISPASVTVPSGGSSSITVTVGPVASNVTGELTCDVVANGQTSTYQIDLFVAFRPLVVPTLQQWGLVLMTLALGAFGFMALRRRDA